MIAKASRPESISRRRVSLLLPDSDPDAHNERIRPIQTKFESEGYDVSLCSLTNLPSVSTDVVSLLEIDDKRPFFKATPQARFKDLLRLIETCYSRGNKILWITGPSQICAQNPYHAMVLGLARTVRLELGSVFATLELDINGLGSLQCTSIVRVFRKLQSGGSLSYDNMDYEFALANDNICIPRYTTINTEVLLRKTVDSSRGAKSLFIKSPGRLNTLQWGSHSRATGLLDNEVEIIVRTASLNSWVLFAPP
jgi:hypothetical protein